MSQLTLFHTPPTAPFSNPMTSKEAAEAIQPTLGAIESKVLGFIVGRKRIGATCDEVERLLGFRHQTASARIYDLAQKGLIQDSGDRRETSSGRRAIVWVAA